MKTSLASGSAASTGDVLIPSPQELLTLFNDYTFKFAKLVRGKTSRFR
jgi:hypothetical protein